MTVSTNPTPDFQRDQILTAAIRLCGLLSSEEEPDANQIQAASVHFSMGLLELQAEGIELTGRVRTTEPFVADTAEYLLATDTLDVHVDSSNIIGMVVDADDVETPVYAIADTEYQRISDKTTTAERPTRCFVDKGANTLTLVFWPVPSSSEYDFRYTKVRLLRDCDTGDRTLELRRVWAPFMMYRTAIGVACDNSRWQLADRFKIWADRVKGNMAPVESQNVSIQLRVGHSGRNWR